MWKQFSGRCIEQIWTFGKLIGSHECRFWRPSRSSLDTNRSPRCFKAIHCIIVFIIGHQGSLRSLMRLTFRVDKLNEPGETYVSMDPFISCLNSWHQQYRPGLKKQYSLCTTCEQSRGCWEADLSRRGATGNHGRWQGQRDIWDALKGIISLTLLKYLLCVFEMYGTLQGRCKV